MRFLPCINRKPRRMANEIAVSAEEEVNIEKLQLVEAEKKKKKKIRPEYERKDKQVEIRKKISGGGVLASRDGEIVCENTLDARLDVVFRKKLPEIRKWLFDQIAA